MDFTKRASIMNKFEYTRVILFITLAVINNCLAMQENEGNKDTPMTEDTKPLARSRKFETINAILDRQAEEYIALKEDIQKDKEKIEGPKALEVVQSSEEEGESEEPKPQGPRRRIMSRNNDEAGPSQTIDTKREAKTSRKTVIHNNGGLNICCDCCPNDSDDDKRTKCNMPSTKSVVQFAAAVAVVGAMCYMKGKSAGSSNSKF